MTPAPATTPRPGTARISPPCSARSADRSACPGSDAFQQRSSQRQRKYRVPISNPFVVTTQPAKTAWREKFYALGCATCSVFCFDPPSDKLIAGDVGQDHVEEIDLIEAGKNYGWNRKEGTFPL